MTMPWPPRPAILSSVLPVPVFIGALSHGFGELERVLVDELAEDEFALQFFLAHLLGRGFGYTGFLQLFHHFAGRIDAIVFCVERRTRTKGFDIGVPRVADALLDRVAQPLRGMGVPSGDIACARGRHKCTEVEGPLDVAIDGRRGLGSQRSRGGQLPPCIGVNEAVEQYVGDVRIAPSGVNEVVAADGATIAVTGECDHGELGTGKLEPGGERKGTAMKNARHIEVDDRPDDVVASDPTYDHDLVSVQRQLVYRPEQGEDGLRLATAGTKQVDVRLSEVLVERMRVF